MRAAPARCPAPGSLRLPGQPFGDGPAQARGRGRHSGPARDADGRSRRGPARSAAASRYAAARGGRAGVTRPKQARPPARGYADDGRAKRKPAGARLSPVRPQRGNPAP
jgi:hypothetical protein